MNHILNCRKCGSSNHFWSILDPEKIKCSNCGFNTGPWDTKQEAITEWNDRGLPHNIDMNKMRSAIFEVLRRHEVDEECFTEIAAITYQPILEASK